MGEVPIAERASDTRETDPTGFVRVRIARDHMSKPAVEKRARRCRSATPETPIHGRRRQLEERPRTRKRHQDLRPLLDGAVPLRMGEKHCRPSISKVGHDHLERRRPAVIRGLDEQEMRATAEREPRVALRAEPRQGVERHLTTGEDLDLQPLVRGGGTDVVQRRQHLRHRRRVVLADVRGSHDDPNAVGDHGPEHRAACLEIGGPVVQTGQDMAVEVDHGSVGCCRRTAGDRIGLVGTDG